VERFGVLLQLLDQLVDDGLRALVDGRVHLLAHEVRQFVLVRQRLDLVDRRRDTALDVRQHCRQVLRLAHRLRPASTPRPIKLIECPMPGLYLSNFIRGGVEVLAIEVDDRANA